MTRFTGLTRLCESDAHRDVGIWHQLCNVPTPRLIQRLQDARVSPVGDFGCDDISQDADIEHHILVGVIDRLAEVEDRNEGELGLGTRQRGKHRNESNAT